MQVVCTSGGILEPVSGAVLQLKGDLTVFVDSTPPWVTIMSTISQEGLIGEITETLTHQP